LKTFRAKAILDNKLISRQIKDQTILITGAAGSIGSEIVRQVLGFNLKHHYVRSGRNAAPVLEAESIVSSAKICNVVADIRNKGIE
jgi:FlaA1/EpsC-like NDP-sugar epimerase